MENIIDIQLVKEQLRLLGHNVADEMILKFVKGLNTGTGAQRASGLGGVPGPAGPTECDAGSRDANAPAAKSQLGALQPNSSSKGAAGRQQLGLPPAGTHAPITSWRAQSDTDAAPSKLQQAPDQQSPKRLPAAAGPAAAQQEHHSPPAQNAMQRTALDQRCRNFLSRRSDKPSPQQVQAQPQQQQQLRPIVLQVPQLQHSTASGTHHSSSASSGQQSASAGSSELLLDYAGADSDDADSANSNSSSRGLGQRQLQGAQQLPAARALHASAAAGYAQLQSLQQQQAQQQWVQAQPDPASAGEGSCSGDSEADADSDSEGSSVCLEAEGSKFLLHQAATMQRVRARLAAKMAGFTASAAAASARDSSGNLQETQPQQQPLHDSQVAAASSAAAAANDMMASAAAQLGAAGDSSRGHAAPTTAIVHDQELPRFGFRPGYKPVGIHMPPAPSSAAVEALAAARALRQQEATAAAPTAVAGASASSRAAAVPQLQLDMPLHMQSLASAVDRLHLQQQQIQQVHSRAEAVLGSCALPLVVSPGTAACASVVAGARSSGSIIAGETTPCIAAGSSKPRQSPRVDPLYLAPSSPMRSNPATPRSSPSCSPAPLAPLSAAAVGLGLRRSPAGRAPAAAPTAGRSSAGAGATGSRQSLSFSASGSSRAGPGRNSSSQALQQQRVSAMAAGAGSVRRVSSAPATPSAQAPAAAGPLRSAGCGPSTGTASTAAGYSARRPSSVSHESLYCQRLAYSSQRSAVAPGVRKTDRVARFQQMQQQWAKDSFLRSGAGGAATAKKSSGQQSHL